VDFRGVSVLASNVIEPEELQLKVSLAEESIIESVRNAVARFVEIVDEISRIVEDLLSMRFEGARNRVQKSLATYASCKEIVETTYLRFARTSTLLMHNLHYLNLLNSLSSMLQNVHRMLIHLLPAGKNMVSSDEKALLSLQKFVTLLNMYLKTSLEFFNAYLSRSPKTEELLNQLSKISNDLESYIKDLVLNNSHFNQLTPITLDMETLAYSATNLYEATLCLYLAKKS